MNFLNKLIKIADKLDKKGLYKEADMLDGIIAKAILMESGRFKAEVNENGETIVYDGDKNFRYMMKVEDKDGLENLLQRYNKLNKDLESALDEELEHFMPSPQPISIDDETERRWIYGEDS